VKRPPMARLAALFVVLVFSMGGIFLRLTILQVSQANQYRDLALNQRERTVTLAATRGEILDRSRDSLAMSLDARDVYADGRFVRDPLATADKIAPLLHVKPRTLMPALSSPSSFSYLARGVPMGVAAKIAALHLPGIQFLSSSRRFYPAGPLAPQVLGFVGTDGTGLSGLEAQYESVLAGRSGKLTQEIDRNGQPIAGSVTVDVPPVPGQSVVTTIDRDLQYQVQSALQRAVEANHAKGGTVIVLDPRTGEILAMATYPWFDPNDYQASPQETWRNRSVTDVFEPGSVIKVITAAAAVEEHAVGLDQKFVVPPSLRVDSTYTIHDSHFHPVERMTIGDIIAQSSNIGTVKIAALVGSDAFAGYLARFGFGQSTGLGFPGEASGILPPLFDWTAASMATIPYGQGIAVTPLQMASVYATIANGGTWIQPRLVKGTIDPSGTYHASAPQATREVVSPQTARTVASMLAMAVQAGTGTEAQIPGYQVAGKTGTARIPLPNRAGYYTNRDVASFIGMLPASSPRVVVAAIIDRPTTVYGGVAAAPLFQEVARYAIQRMGIEPGTPLKLPPHLMPVR
jgi:cell division protein FtsI (penicillin-binding protein 3)